MREEKFLFIHNFFDADFPLSIIFVPNVEASQLIIINLFVQ